MLKKGSVHTVVSLLRAIVCVGLISTVFALASLLTQSAPAFAQGTDALGLASANVGSIATSAGLPQTDLLTIIGRVINVVLGLTGIVLLVLILYAGYLWMTSGGEMEKVESAQRMMKNAVIGLLIVVSAFAITKFIFDMLLGAVNEGGSGVAGTDSGRVASGFPSAAGSLGRVIESHIPERNATNVPRNTAIIITFKEPIKLESVITGWNDAGTPDNSLDDPMGLNDEAIKVFPNTAGAGSNLRSDQVRVRYTADRKTIVLKPVSPLGSPTANTDYTVKLLPGRLGVLLADGTSVFRTASSLGSGAGYEWSFQVSTQIDTTPPQVQSVVPIGGGAPYAPNIIMQMNFNEPIDPTSASGIYSALGGFTNIEVVARPVASPTTSDARVYGEFKISNGYRTVEFVPTLSCGVNSCGRQIFCLPFSASVGVNIKSASLGTNPPQAEFTRSGYDGVVDVAGNALDGGDGHGGPVDGIAQGSPTDAIAGDDSYSYRFATTDRPNLNPPKIRSTIPQAGNLSAYTSTAFGSSEVPSDLTLRATFGGDLPGDGVLQSSTVNTREIVVNAQEPATLQDTFWWQPRQIFLNESGQEAQRGDPVVAGAITISHRLFTPATESLGAPPMYNPFFYSGLQNVYQNCFNPSASPSCSGPFCCNDRRQGGSCSFAPTPSTP